MVSITRSPSYTDADIVGKRACYVQLKAINATLLSKPETEHRYGNLVRGGTLLVTGDVLRRLRFDHVPRGSDTKLLRRAKAEGIQSSTSVSDREARHVSGPLTGEHERPIRPRDGG